MIDLDVLSSAEVAADRAAEGQPRFWRSTSDLRNTPAHRALLKDEFHPAAQDASDLEGDPGPSRRSFMKIMGASMAMAGLTGCRRPVEKVLPYARKPEDIVPGIPNFYATAMPMGGYVQPLLVESHEGRPTKVEGNPEHPMSLGATDVFAQASILNLYDPDRSQSLRRREGGAAAWSEVVRSARGLAGQRVIVLSEPTSSPTVQRLRDQLRSAGNVEWITYRAMGDDNAALGAQGVSGRAVRPLYNFSEAQTIVSFDADFLSGDNAVHNSREYAASRRVMDGSDEMSRLYVIESAFTTTGGMADHRRRMKAGTIPFFAAAVAARLGVSEAGSAGSMFADDPFVAAIAEDAQTGNTVFVAGATQPAAVHALCARLNAQLSGGAVQMLDTGDDAPVAQGPAMQRLVREMESGAVDVLVMIGVNPVYDAPPALGFADALARVPTSIHLGMYLDETARAASWHIPRTHYLEQWGDGRAYDGTYSVVQPLIAPLYDAARSEVEVLNLLATGEEASAYDLVRDTIRQQGFLSGNFEDAWRTLLHDGFLPNTQYTATTGGTVGATGALSQLTVPAEDAIEVVIRPDAKLLDGRFSNNAWMHEVPDPVTKVTWDAVAQMSAATAEALGLSYTEEEAGIPEGGAVEAGRVQTRMLAITVNGEGIEVPAWIQPGHPDGSITVTMGYGRDLGTERVITDRGLLARLFDRDVDIYSPGPVANGVGANASLLRGVDGSSVIPAADIEVLADSYMIATTQDHGALDVKKRPLVRMTTLDEYRAQEDFAQKVIKPIEDVPWQDFPAAWNFNEDDPKANTPTSDPRIGEALYSDNQWGMTIDLNACSGCNACVVACQSENNIMVVGKDQIARGREMHWLRMDRYYVSERGGDADEMTSPQMVMQPMLCQQCEYAPCESVCPVAATSHSPDGLNEMTYNRCIGTRYCSNNCPYKVRRFNFYNWTKTLPVQVQMGMNPDVTMRFRGVMEKCTWCVQRIRATQQVAHIENRKIEDGEVQTACQQVCPTDAIVFGDLMDSDSRVRRMKENPRSYELLEELNVKPRLSYLARLRNPNPTLAARLGQEAAQPAPAPDA